jgi:hypothetical protein
MGGREVAQFAFRAGIGWREPRIAEARVLLIVGK